MMRESIRAVLTSRAIEVALTAHDLFRRISFVVIVFLIALHFALIVVRWFVAAS